MRESLKYPSEGKKQGVAGKEKKMERIKEIHKSRGGGWREEANNSNFIDDIYSFFLSFFLFLYFFSLFLAARTRQS